MRRILGRSHTWLDELGVDGDDVGGGKLGSERGEIDGALDEQAALPTGRLDWGRGRSPVAATRLTLALRHSPLPRFLAAPQHPPNLSEYTKPIERKLRDRPAQSRWWSWCDCSTSRSVSAERVPGPSSSGCMFPAYQPVSVFESLWTLDLPLGQLTCTKDSAKIAGVFHALFSP